MSNQENDIFFSPETKVFAKQNKQQHSKNRAVHIRFQSLERNENE